MYKLQHCNAGVDFFLNKTTARWRITSTVLTPSPKQTMKLGHLTIQSNKKKWIKVTGQKEHLYKKIYIINKATRNS